MVSEERLIADFLGNGCIRHRQELVVRLVDNEPAFSEHVERDEGNSTGDQNRDGIERDALPERFLDLFEEADRRRWGGK